MPPPRIVVAGGTGLLGRALADALAASGHDVVVLTRKASSVTVDAAHGDEATRAGVRLAHWRPDGTTGPWTALLDGAVAVVNLAGESIGEGRWSASRKVRLRESRYAATRSLVAALGTCARPPVVFVSASGVGYYGMRPSGVLTEDSPPGSDFIAELCSGWEAIAREAAGNSRRVITVRSGLVLDRTGGALPRMLAPFRFFVGGRLGSGSQYVSWIHIDDWVALVTWALAEPALDGPLNATSPNPVTNEEFSGAIGAALGRRSWLPAPSFGLRILLGEMADSLLLGGQRAVPARAVQHGFKFRYPEVAGALQAVLRRR